MRVPPSGLEGVVAGRTGICTVDGAAGRLVYRGIAIQELAAQSHFEEVVYLLWYGELPTRSQLENLKQQLAAERALPPGVEAMLRGFPRTARPMDVLRTAVSALGIWDPDTGDNSPAANERKAVRLTARIPTLIAAFHALRRGRPPVAPRTDLSLAAHCLYLLHGEEPTPTAARSFDIALILHADHEFNASTFAARVTVGTLSDMYAAITSGIGALAGPLHGGANEGVMRMLQEIRSVSEVEAYIKEKLARREKIMGFGHRVYKTTDPRAAALKEMARSLTVEAGQTRLYEISERIERVMWEEKQLHANVDFYSATVYHVLGIPIDLFTPVFAISRISGWTAHVMEQLADNRLIRPRAEYVGPDNVPYVPIEQRG
ncbi:MAG: citrate synthase [Armatimonadetes bacterium]|nr:citrate synthase [Armatimonadota bacterium]